MDTTQAPNTMPCVSIIINNYNYGRFVQQAIRSALEQTHPAIEVVVVDDGSTDASREIIAQCDARITTVFKQNGGQASALNAGFAACSGDIVIFLDADDVLLPHAAAAVAQAFVAHPALTKVMYRMAVVDEHGELTGELKPAPHLPLPSGDTRQRLLSAPFDQTWASTSGNAFSAAVLRQIMPIPEPMYGRIGADWYLGHIAPLFGSILFIDEVCAWYRIHGGNHYQRNNVEVDFEYLLQTIHYSYITAQLIISWAQRLGLPCSPPLLSISDIKNRMILLRLAGARYPSYQDSSYSLARMGIVAAFRRNDVLLPMRLLFAGWFIAMLLAPRQLGFRLAKVFLFPEVRGPLNHILSLLHK